MVKNTLILLTVSLLVFLYGSCVLAEGIETIEIEQVHINKPNINVYLKLKDYNIAGKDIVLDDAFYGEEALSTEKVGMFEKSDGITYLCLVDVSISMTQVQIQQIKQSLLRLVENSDANDRFILITIGVTPEKLLDGVESTEIIKSAINGLKNKQGGTSLYASMLEAVKMSNLERPDFPQRTIALVFSDTVNDNPGGVTINELEETLEASNLPLYAFSFNNNSGDYLDAFGRLARKSGGESFTVTSNNLQARLDAELLKINNCRIAYLKAQTNRISEQSEVLRFNVCVPEDSPSKLSLKKDVLAQHFVSDTVAPEITVVEKISATEVKIYFSKDVQGADVASNYRILPKDSDQPLVVKEAKYSREGQFALIAMEHSIITDNYIVSVVPGSIWDNTQNENPVQSEKEVKISGRSRFIVWLEYVLAQYWWLSLLITLAVLAVLIFLVYKKIEKSGGNVKILGGWVYMKNDPEDKVHIKGVASSERKPLKLIITGFGGKTVEIDRKIDRSIFVGRSNICDIYIDDPQLSKQHFVIEEDGGAFYITDLRTTNGTFLNGIKILNRRKIYDNDIITAGQLKIVLKKQKQEA